MSIEAMKRVVEAFDALPPDHPARYANLQINLLRTAIQRAEAKTDEPVAWNSIQIASWIGSQLMHEPSMFERAAVCKFVRSLGRHPTLLKHSPKIHPAPSVPADVVRDAISAVREHYRGTDWGKAAESICDAIDAAMLAAKEKL